MNGQTIELPDAPRIDGLRFRTFAGESDYPEMVRCIAEAAEGEGDWLSVDVMRSMDAFTPWVDVNKDRIIVEVGGKMIGAGRVQTGRNVAGERVYFHSFNLLPQWRGKGIGTAALLHNERRLREIAADHPDDGPRFFQPFNIPEAHVATQRLLLRHGYEHMRSSYEMVRPTLDNVPDCPLPAGLKIRPIEPSHLPEIWEADREAFRDHWNCVLPKDDAYEAWCTNPIWRKELSAVAWDGNHCVGMVLGLVSDEENQKQGKKRIWTESICVRRPWRKRGVARALMAKCIELGREAGFKEAALGVDAENLSGALRLYESMGYQVTKTSKVYRKPMQ